MFKKIMYRAKCPKSDPLSISHMYIREKTEYLSLMLFRLGVDLFTKIIEWIEWTCD